VAWSAAHRPTGYRVPDPSTIQCAAGIFARPVS
jgi:hypothetical protein